MICMVQIKEDFVNTANKGKILPWKIPFNLYKKIVAAASPTEEDLKAGIKPMDVLHPIMGHDISLRIDIKHIDDRDMRDYDNCKIIEAESSILVNGYGVDIAQYKADAEYAANAQKAIIEMLKDVSDVYTTFGYTEASVDVKRKVKRYLSKHVDVTDIWPEIDITAAQAAAAQQAEQKTVDPFANQQSNQAKTQSAQQAEQPAATQQAANPFGGQPAAGASNTQQAADFAAQLSGKAAEQPAATQQAAQPAATQQAANPFGSQPAADAQAANPFGGSQSTQQAANPFGGK
jgi:pyruvate/2-oxoglutarate dehydrogenase complex dihydrolipoamide acyltransferase (E2) component